MIDIEKSVSVICVVFDDFEALDLMGPVEFLSGLPNTELRYVSLRGGLVQSRQQFQLLSEKMDSLPLNSILLLAGGQGVGRELHHQAFLHQLKSWIEQAEAVLSVCTSVALLAELGLLNGLKATSNKIAWSWIVSLYPCVDWKRQARWVSDGKFYTSSGVSAGMDMTLGFVADSWGREQAERLAYKAEYIWNDRSDRDPFAAEKAP